MIFFSPKRLGDFFCPERLGDFFLSREVKCFFCPITLGDFFFVPRGWLIFFLSQEVGFFLSKKVG